MGKLVERGVVPHECDTPSQATPGDVWLCDCGLRWRCHSDVTDWGNVMGMYADWRPHRQRWDRLRRLLSR